MGIRHVSQGVEVEFEGLARVATEFVCSRTTVLADSADWNPLPASRGSLRLQREHGLQRLREEMAAGRAEENLPDPRSTRVRVYV